MSDNDLIRRGDAREILEDEGFLERSLERLAAIPAVQPTVSPELLATTNDVAALEKILSERGAVFDAMVDAAEDAAGKGVSFNVVIGRALRAALARVKGVM